MFGQAATRWLSLQFLTAQGKMVGQSSFLSHYVLASTAAGGELRGVSINWLMPEEPPAGWKNPWLTPCRSRWAQGRRVPSQVTQPRTLLPGSGVVSQALKRSFLWPLPAVQQSCPSGHRCALPTSVAIINPSYVYCLCFIALPHMPQQGVAVRGQLTGSGSLLLGCGFRD